MAGVVLAGCVSSPLKPTIKPQGPAAEAPAECTAQASAEGVVARLARAVGYGTVGAFILVPQGAHEGANWTLVTVRHLTCGRVNELALWLVDRRIFRQAGEGWPASADGRPAPRDRTERLA